ncbi:hypothetical protein C8Q77DRAFT_1076474 [Trametes polyzona]|nr:hypothetical protein C8Q77DRAFT_1076474 [Trametes polyzona]
MPLPAVPRRVKAAQERANETELELAGIQRNLVLQSLMRDFTELYFQAIAAAELLLSRADTAPLADNPQVLIVVLCFRGEATTTPANMASVNPVLASTARTGMYLPLERIPADSDRRGSPHKRSRWTRGSSGCSLTDTGARTNAPDVGTMEFLPQSNPDAPLRAGQTAALRSARRSLSTGCCCARI